jgi:hypothetical protein
MNVQTRCLPPLSDKSNNLEPAAACVQRRPETKEVHIRVSIPNYQYLDQLAIRYGIRSLSGAINFLIESHRQAQTSPNLGPAHAAAKQAE